VNKTFADTGKAILKSLLAQCTEAQQLMFKRMYSHKNLEVPIDVAVDNMDENRIDHAITQCERTVEKNIERSQS
jgi:hypothetical protein